MDKYNHHLVTPTCIHPVHGMIMLCNRIRMCRKYQQDMSAMFIIISLIHYWYIHFHIFINSLKPTEITTKTTTLHSTHTLNYTLIHDMHKQITILPHWRLHFILKIMARGRGLPLNSDTMLFCIMKIVALHIMNAQITYT